MLKGPTESAEAVSTLSDHPVALPFTKFPFKRPQCPGPPPNHDDALHLPTNITVNVIPSSESDIVAPDCLCGFIQSSLDSTGASAIDPVVALRKGKRRGRKPKIVVAEEDKENVARIGHILEHESRLAVDDISAMTNIERNSVRRLLTSTAYFARLFSYHWIISPNLTPSQLKSLRSLSKSPVCTIKTFKERVKAEIARLEAVYAESPVNCFEGWNGALVVEQELLEWRGNRRGWVEETFELVPVKDSCNPPVFDAGTHSLEGTFI